MRAIVPSSFDFADHARWIQSRHLGKIDDSFRVTGADQHTLPRP
jgi:hypothetical protein